MGEFLRLPATSGTRQGRNCSPDDFDAADRSWFSKSALAIFHQLLYDEWMTGSLSGPLARIKVDEKNCFGMIEWKAVREAASRFLPKHTAAAAWKHRNLSHVEQEGSCQCRRIEAQSKSRDARKHCRAASGGHPSLGWRERLCRGTATASRPRGQIAGISKLPAWWPRKAHRCP